MSQKDLPRRWNRKRPPSPDSRGPQRPRQRSHRAASREGEENVSVLYGWHTVKAALENPARRIRRLWVTENAIGRLRDDAVSLPVELEIVRPDWFVQRLTPDAVHQGLLAEADPLDAPALEDFAAAGIVLVLDQITDPHNVGAILRSAAAFDVKAVVTTARHSPEATGVLAKAASGALEVVPMVTVVNLARGLAALRERGFQLVGLDSSGSIDLAKARLTAPLALVLGAEGKGLRHLTRETCDVVARLDLPGAIASLNVSNAAVLALYIANTRTEANS